MSLWFSRARAASVLALALAVVLGLAPFAGAQGVQTSTLSGTVSASDGAMLPGVSVTIGSPSLQGERSVTTDANGNYIFRGLPGGTYKVAFTLSGFGTVERDVTIALGTTPNVNATLAVASVTESVTVTAVAPSVLETTVVGANFKADKVDMLATGRTIQAIATLAPGLTTNTPNQNQLSIAGAFAYDNVFLLNGVDINDNLFGTANNLFIEDAIDEVQVLTSGISAEYGRFSGGVVNAVTKRGGNKFTGSFRTDFTNSAWQDESRFEKDQIAKGTGQPHLSKLNKAYQATFGGPIVKDRLWFFVAGRRLNLSESRTLAITGGGYEFAQKNPRYEAKLTGSITPNHTITGSYISSNTTQENFCSINCTLSIDSKTLINRETPNNLFVANYNGVLSPSLFLEAQYSQKKFGFRNAGGTETNIEASPFRALGRVIASNSHYNAPYFDATDPEDRNNQQYSAALSYFLSTGSFGRHDLKVGAENYTSTRTGGNSQAATSMVFFADPVMGGGVPVRDANGNIQPNWQPGVTQLVNFIAVRGAEINLHTLSAYVNDRWQLNNHLSFNLGVRYERHTADTTQAGIVTPESSVFVPRLGATFDVKGDGQWILQATYARYAGKASETQFADNTNVGTPSQVNYLYNGPAGQGVDFAPGFNLANYTVIGGQFPIANIFLDTGLKTPNTREFTLQAGTRLGARGEFKAIYTNRKMGSLLENFITLDRGRTTVTQNGRTFGTFDNQFITNSDIPHREYQALEAITNYRITDTWSVSGNYTLQIKNDGNFEGEAGNQPGNYSIIGDRPEFFQPERIYPDGHLVQFQRHRVRLYTTYDLSLGKAGRASLGVLYRYDSATTYSLAANSVPLSAIQKARDPGYANVPTTQTLYFAARGTEFFSPQHLFDFALNYDVPVWKSAKPWFKLELRNAFNTQPLISFNTTIQPDNNGPKDAFGLPVNYIKASAFGQSQSNLSYPTPREFLASVGFRF